MSEDRETYWFRSGADADRGRRMLQALRGYHAAETAMRRRTREAMHMGDNELVALRFLIRAEGKGEQVTPTDIARYVGISTASTTSLLDRLERMGHIERERHATDRRSVTLRSTPLAAAEVRNTLGDMHGRMMAATAGVSDAEAEAIIGFLERVSAAVDEVGVAVPALPASA
ncbi:MarR family winged helix-turn-helix transcriptional regulator [Microbacterium sp. NPDC091313]